MNGRKLVPIIEFDNGNENWFERAPQEVVDQMTSQTQESVNTYPANQTPRQSVPLSEAMKSDDIFSAGGHPRVAQQPVYGGTAGRPIYADQYPQHADDDRVFIDDEAFGTPMNAVPQFFAGAGGLEVLRMFTELAKDMAPTHEDRLAMFAGQQLGGQPQMPANRAIEAPQQSYYPETYERQQSRAPQLARREKSARDRSDPNRLSGMSEKTKKHIAKAALLGVVALIGVVVVHDNMSGESPKANSGRETTSTIPKDAKKVEIADFTGSPAGCMQAATYTSSGKGYFSVPFVSRAGNNRRYPNATTFKRYQKGTNVNFANEIELGVCPIKGESAFIQNGSEIKINLDAVELLAKAKPGSVFAARADTRGLAKLKKSQRTQITSALKSKTMAAPEIRVEAMTAIVEKLQQTQHDDMQAAAIEALKQFKLDEATKNNQKITFADEVLGDVARPTIVRKDHFGDVYGDQDKVLYLRKGVRLEVAGLNVTPKGTQS